MNPLSFKLYFYMNERKVIREAFESIYLKRWHFYACLKILGVYISDSPPNHDLADKRNFM